MSDEMTRRERWAAADVARNDARWGMNYVDDQRPTPEQLAYAAYQRGDRWFQIDVPLFYAQGTTRAYDNYTRTHRQADPAPDVIGPIESQGWILAHVATAFVLRGETGMENIGGAFETANHGELVALYVFRRVEHS